METSVGETKARFLVDKVLTRQGGKNAQRETGEGKKLTPNNNRGTSPSPISDQQNGVSDLVSFFSLMKISGILCWWLLWPQYMCPPHDPQIESLTIRRQSLARWLDLEGWAHEEGMDHPWHSAQVALWDGGQVPSGPASASALTVDLSFYNSENHISVAAMLGQSSLDQNKVLLMMVIIIQDLVLFEPTKGYQKIKEKLMLKILPIWNSTYWGLVLSEVLEGRGWRRTQLKADFRDAFISR